MENTEKHAKIHGMRKTSNNNGLIPGGRKLQRCINMRPLPPFPPLLGERGEGGGGGAVWGEGSACLYICVIFLQFNKETMNIRKCSPKAVRKTNQNCHKLASGRRPDPQIIPTQSSFLILLGFCLFLLGFRCFFYFFLIFS